MDDEEDGLEDEEVIVGTREDEDDCGVRRG
jgi:hypothetical protein